MKRALRLRAWFESAPFWQLSLGLFACAFLLRFVYLLEIKDSDFFRAPVGDAFSYDEWATAIQKDFIGKEVFYQAPLYPYFLAVIYALFGHDLFVARVIQAAFGAGACVLLAGAGRAFFSRKIGLFAGLLLAAYAPALFFTGILQKTTLDLFFTAALLYGLARVERDSRRGWLTFTGLVLGCLALTRENALLLLPLLGVWFGYRRGWRTLAPFLLGASLVLSPVALRNYAVGGEAFVTTSQFGVNLYLGNNAEADGTYTPLRFGRGSFAMEREDAIELAEHELGRQLSPAEVSHYWSSKAFGWMTAQPWAFTKLLARKWLLVWNDHEIPDSDEPAVYLSESTLLRATWLLFSFGTLCPLALVGFVTTLDERRRLGTIYLLLLGSAASAALFVVFARYRAPLIPPLALFAAVGLAQLGEVLQQRRLRLALSHGALMAGAVVITRIPLVTAEGSRAMAFYNVGVTLETQGQPKRAAENYRSALSADPNFEQAHVNLGALLAREGSFAEAIEQEQTALLENPKDAVAHTIWANALLESGQLDAADQ
ncbi:MAG TPA: glycosyltransferase family 39 protein, partial [Polyangiaceae bacterium]|nr:glycosyltransferase family 39 protein [Polyangiaceae bacterium]